MPYRYKDEELVSALNIALVNAHRLRRDLFLKYTTTPNYPVLAATEVDIDEGYRRAILFFICGHASFVTRRRRRTHGQGRSCNRSLHR